MSRERVERIVRGYERFNRGELDEALAGFSPDIQWIVPDMLPDVGPYTGPDGVRRFWQTWHETFEDFRIEVVEIHDLEDHVIAITRVHGTGRDSGVEVSTPSFPAVWTWRGDKIIRMEMFQSESSAREAIGKDWR